MNEGIIDHNVTNVTAANFLSATSSFHEDDNATLPTVVIPTTFPSPETPDHYKQYEKRLMQFHSAKFVSYLLILMSGTMWSNSDFKGYYVTLSCAIMSVVGFQGGLDISRSKESDISTSKIMCLFLSGWVLYNVIYSAVCISLFMDKMAFVLYGLNVGTQFVCCANYFEFRRLYLYDRTRRASSDSSL